MSDNVDPESRARNQFVTILPAIPGGPSSSLSHQHRCLAVDNLGGNIDVMVVWTKRSENKKSGLDPDCILTDVTENNIRRLINLAIAGTNTAYNLSGARFSSIISTL
mgnify:CR=1 FL=1|jgi:hypothetical protein